MEIANLPPRYSTNLFTDIYNNADDFYNDWVESGLYTEEITEANIRYLFYLLYAKYGNNPIANADITQFKYKLWSIIFGEGPNWQKRLDIQKTLRKLEEADLLVTETYKSINDHTGSASGEGTSSSTNKTKTNGKSIDNHANHPSVDPSTDVDEPLPYIDSQDYSHVNNEDESEGTANTTTSTSNTAKDVLESVRTTSPVKIYTQLWEILKDDITTEFIGKFKVCFKFVVVPERPTLYINEIDEEEP